MERPLIDLVWVMICAGLVFLMQAGFTCLESGLTRSKNSINVAIKNIADFGVSVFLFWMFGFALMFGMSKGGWIGSTHFFTPVNHAEAWLAVFFLFQAMFCGTATTIVSGAVAERMRFGGYLIVAMCLSGLIYTLFGHWAWGGTYAGSPGWLARLGFVDFAGSTVVHSVGGWVALAAVVLVGPRIGRFPPDAPPRKISGHNLPVAILGMLLLWFGWLGFNGGSMLTMNDHVPGILANTIMAGVAGILTTMCCSWLLQGRPEVTLMINGSLAGLVAVTASVHAVSTLAAVIIGGIGGIVMIMASQLLVLLRIDDAVGAIPVHAGAGVWGTLAVALFGNPEALGTGLSRGAQLGVQLFGIGVGFVWAFGISYLLLYVVKRIFPLRVTPEEEHIGLNAAEHGATTELLDLFIAIDEQARTGDMSLRVPVEPFTEVGQIAERYNRAMDALQQAVAKTEAIVRTATDAIVTFSKKSLAIASVNPSAAAIFGYREQQMLGQGVSKLLGPPQDQLHQNDPLPVDLLLPHGSDHASCEVVGKRADGSLFPVEITVAEVELGQEPFYTGTFRDITERKRLHDQEEAYLQQLEKFNATLEQRVQDATVSLEESNQLLERQLREITALSEVAMAINSVMEVDVVLETIMAKSKEVMQAEASSLLMLEDSGKLRFQVAQGTAGAALQSATVDVGQGIAGWVAEKGMPLLIPDAYRDRRFDSSYDERSGFRTRSILTVPLKMREEIAGVVQVVNKIGKVSFDEHDLNLFRSFASQASVALENARLYERTKAMAEDLREALEHERRLAIEKEKMGAYIPKQVVDDISRNREQKLALGGKTVRTTILFSDIKGFTRLSEDMEPQRIVDVLNVYMTAMTTIIEEEGGLVDKFIGDGIMAIFPPLNEEDNHALWAVQAGVRMQHKLHELRADWQANRPEAMGLQVRVGINTGEVVAGNIGSETRMDYTVVGDNVNVASRIESACEPGEVYLSESTYQDMHHCIEAINKGPISVKNRVQPVQMYAIQIPAAAEQAV